MVLSIFSCVYLTSIYLLCVKQMTSLCLFRSFAHFKTRIFVFLLSFNITLNILGMSPLSDTWFTDIFSPIFSLSFHSLKSMIYSPVCCGSVGWASSLELKGLWFHSPSGHTPGLLARSPVEGVWETASRCFSCTSMFFSLYFSLPSPFSKNK